MEFVKRIHLCNILFFSIFCIQLLVILFISGWTPNDFLPVIGIGLVVVMCSVILLHYSHKKGVGAFTCVFNFGMIVLYAVFGITFAGPFDRLLQLVMLVFIGINLLIIGSTVVNLGQRLKSVLKKESLTDRESPASDSMLAANYMKNSRKLGLTLFIMFLGTLLFTGLATINFGYTYTQRAPDNFKTRSSYWGSPFMNESRQSHSIVPIDNYSLIVSNSSLGQSFSNLRPGALLYVTNVSHTSNPTINYCNYLQGAQSFPNGTVRLSSPLPTVENVSIDFVYMSNIIAMEYLQWSDSRIISTNWGNYTWINSPNLFHSIRNTFQYLMFEYWNLSYYINMDVHALSFPHIYNYLQFIERGRATIDWILTSQPFLAHCVGISYDFEKGNLTDASLSPARPPIGQTPFPTFTDQKGYLSNNEQYPEILEAVKTAYFTLYDYIVSNGLEAYIVYQYSALKDLPDGDIDITRLPIWIHPACEYGMMSYQDGDTAEEALWKIYENNHNQHAIYGEQGYTILTGWVTINEPEYLKYYTDDEEGLQRYIRDIQMHQACGVREIFHAFLLRMQQKWGDDAILRVEEALNQAPKQTFIFKALPWDDMNSILYDTAENFNQLVYAVPSLFGIIFFFIYPSRSKKQNPGIRKEKL